MGNFWENLSQGIQATGQNVTNLLMTEYMRKRDEQEKIRGEARQHQYKMIEFKEQQERLKADALEMHKKTIAMTDELERDRSAYNQKVDASLGSPEFMQYIKIGLSHPDPSFQKNTMMQFQALNKLKTGEDLTAAEDKLLASIQDPIVAQGIAGLRVTNRARKLKEDVDRANIAQSEALGHYYTRSLELQETGGRYTYAHLNSIEDDKSKVLGTIQTFMQNQEWRPINDIATKINAKMQGQPPEAIQAEIIKALPGGQADFGIWQNGLATLNGYQDILDRLGEEEKIVRNKLGYPPIPDQPPPSPERPPTPEQPQEKSDEMAEGSKWALQQIFNVATGKTTVQQNISKNIANFVTGQTGRQRTKRVEGVKRIYGLPPTAEVKIFDNLEEEHAFSRSPKSVGKYILVEEGPKETHGLWKVVKIDGKIGVQKVVMPNR